jgi:homoserine dehydrogenase
MSDALRVALLGCGTVGSQVARLMNDQADDLAARIGLPLELVGVAVRRPKRHPDVPPDLLTTDAASLVERDDVDLVVEVIGGIEPARTLLLTALRSGKSVVTANKALLADDGATLHDAAARARVDLYFEAAVAGAIPLVRPLRESLAGDRIIRVIGIVNGTTNFILSRMTAAGTGFAEALAEATALGYAEADPTADIDGFDAAAKAAILAGLAFHTRVTASDVYREGIGEVTAADVASAKAMGCVVKLLAICERTADSVAVRVHPTMIPQQHPLAGVAPSASAVLGDLVAVARNRRNGGRGPGESAYAALRIQPIGEVMTRYHVALDVADRPGVLAAVAQAFADEHVSIQTVRQEGRDDAATLILVTHVAPDAALARTVDRLTAMPMIRRTPSVMRVEGMPSD